jgi:hypothetical protein
LKSVRAVAVGGVWEGARTFHRYMWVKVTLSRAVFNSFSPVPCALQLLSPPPSHPFAHPLSTDGNKTSDILHFRTSSHSSDTRLVPSTWNALHRRSFRVSPSFLTTRGLHFASPPTNRFPVGPLDFVKSSFVCTSIQLSRNGSHLNVILQGT